MFTFRDRCVYFAELSAEAQRYEDVIQEIKKIVMKFDARLNVDERNLLSIAYKNITNNIRNSWRIVDTLEKMETTRHPGKHEITLLRRARRKIEGELQNVCKDIIELLDEHLLPPATPGEERVFYLKMKADYCRYYAEFVDSEERTMFGDISLDAYKAAYMHATSNLDPLHPTRLGLALNFSVFFHDIRKSPNRACHVAKNALDEAVMSFNSNAPYPQLKDSLMILQLLKDDLIMWATEMNSPGATQE